MDLNSCICIQIGIAINYRCEISQWWRLLRVQITHFHDSYKDCYWLFEQHISINEISSAFQASILTELCEWRKLAKLLTTKPLSSMRDKRLVVWNRQQMENRWKDYIVKRCCLAREDLPSIMIMITLWIVYFRICSIKWPQERNFVSPVRSSRNLLQTRRRLILISTINENGWGSVILNYSDRNQLTESLVVVVVLLA